MIRIWLWELVNKREQNSIVWRTSANWKQPCCDVHHTAFHVWKLQRKLFVFKIFHLDMHEKVNIFIWYTAIYSTRTRYPIISLTMGVLQNNVYATVTLLQHVLGKLLHPLLLTAAQIVNIRKAAIIAGNKLGEKTKFNCSAASCTVLGGQKWRCEQLKFQKFSKSSQMCKELFPPPLFFCSTDKKGKKWYLLFDIFLT